MWHIMIVFLCVLGITSLLSVQIANASLTTPAHLFAEVVTPNIDSLIDRLPTPVTDFIQSTEKINIEVQKKGSDVATYAKNFDIRDVVRNADAWVQRVTGLSVLQIIKAVLGFLEWILKTFIGVFQWILRIIQWVLAGIGSRL